MKRREFIKIIGAASSGSLLSCGLEKQSDKLIARLVPDETSPLPGVGRFIPSTCTACPANCGILVQVRDKQIDGRHRQVPIKIEGNPAHPANRGGLCARGQAALYDLYHPGRLRTPLLRSGEGDLRPVSWDTAFRLILQKLEKTRAEGREALYVSASTTGSLSALIDETCEAIGLRRLPEYEPISYASLWKAYGRLFGRKVIPDFRIDRADALLSIGADLVETWVNPVALARRIADARERNGLRWWHVEPHASLTGFAADRRLVVQPASEHVLLAHLLHRLHDGGRLRQPLPPEVLRRVPRLPREEVLRRTGLEPAQLAEVERLLTGSQRPLLLAGGVATGGSEGLPVAVLAALLQWCTGQIGTTVDLLAGQSAERLGEASDWISWLDAVNAGSVGLQFISRADPVGTLPASLKAGERLRRAGFTVVLAEFPSPTTEIADLVLPLSHSLESWGDAESLSGAWSILQPAVEPIGDTRSEGDILLELQRIGAGAASATSYHVYLQQRWAGRFDASQREELAQEGVTVVRADVAASAVPLRAAAASALLNRELRSLRAEDGSTEGFHVYVMPSLRNYDGRGRSNPLLQEIPDPLTSISYGRWLSVSEEDARQLGIRDADEVSLRVADAEVTLGAKVQPGLPRGVLMVQRDMLPSWPTAETNSAGEFLSRLGNAELRATGRRADLAILAGSHDERGRGIVPRFSGEEKRGEETVASGKADLYPPHEHKDYRWGMAVDLRACTGCSACVAACYVENNVPVVGPEEHRRGREMAWIRIEPYYHDGDAEFIPMMCQQCDNAPCEPVCPVYATYHNPEGLNAQVYNRCVGTRYCSNNCPYKVRRFNWFDHEWPRPLDWMLNPDLSTRGRGVMEKCTFCVQRIRRAKDRARDEGRKVADGEVVPACAQTCPTGAIVFGNLLDPENAVSRAADSERSYRILEHLNTKPAVHYLKKA